MDQGFADAWMTQPSGAGGAAKTTAPPADEPDGGNGGDDDAPLSPRDQYIKEISNAWRTRGPFAWASPGPRMMGPQASPGNPSNPGNGGGSDGNGEAAAVQARYIATISPGVKPGGVPDDGRGRRGAPGGVTMGQHNPSAFPYRDAMRSSGATQDALDDRDAAYQQYLARLTNGWRT